VKEFRCYLSVARDPVADANYLPLPTLASKIDRCALDRYIYPTFLMLSLMTRGCCGSYFQEDLFWPPQ